MPVSPFAHPHSSLYTEPSRSPNHSPTALRWIALMLAVVAESSYRCALTAASRFSFSPLEGGIPFSHPSVLNRCLASPVPGRGLRLLPPLPPSLTLPHHHHLLSPGLATTTEPSADERAPITSLLPIMPLFSCSETGRLPHQQFPLFPPFCFPSCFF